ncbi:hypothetical protein SGLAM104S_06369 [Streptomyces glaucescens]
MICHEPGTYSSLWRTTSRGVHETQSEIDPRHRHAPDRRSEHRTHRPGAERTFPGTRNRGSEGVPRRGHQAADPAAPGGRSGRPRTRRAGPRPGHRLRRGLPHRQAGRATGEKGRRPEGAHPLGDGTRARGRRRGRRLPAVQRTGRHQGGDPQDRTAAPGPDQGGLHRQDPPGAGHPRPEAHQEREEDQGRRQARRAVPVQPARARVDHTGDDPPADAPLPGQLPHRQARQEDRRHHRAVVRHLRQPRRLRLHPRRRRRPPVAQEHAGQQRRRRHHRRRRRRPQPQLRLQVGLRRRRFVPPPHQPDLPRRRTELRARDPGRRPPPEAHRLRVRHQLPLRRRADPLRRGLAGRHRNPGRRALQGARRHPRAAGGPRVPPAGLLRAVHHQRRGGRPRGQRQRHRDVHPGDVDLSDGVERGPGRRLEGRGLRVRLHLPGRREADPAGVRQEHPLRALRRRVRRPPRPAEVRGRHGRPGLHPGGVHHLLRAWRPPGGLRRRPQVGARQGAEVPRQRRPRRGHGPAPLEGRRDLRRRGQPLLRRVPREGRRRRTGRRGRGLVHRRDPRLASGPRANTSPTPSPSGPARTSSSSPRRASPPPTPGPTWTR